MSTAFAFAAAARGLKSVSRAAFSWKPTGRTQQTLAAAVSRSGVGLHSGARATATLLPARAGEGRYFVVEGEEEARVAAEVGNAEPQSPLCTTLRSGGSVARVRTVEHLLSAMEALGVDNCRVEVSGGDEIPLLDGSAQEWVEAIQAAGLCAAEDMGGQKLEKLAPKIDEPVYLRKDDCFVAAFPSSQIHITYGIGFPKAPAIGCQWFNTLLDADIYSSKIAPARTFCIFEEVEKMRGAGLIKVQPQNSHSDGPPLAPCQSRPWWSKPSFLMDQQLHPVPSTVTNSVVSRIKNNGSSWLNAVSNVAASASGKLSVPSGAITAIFYNSIYKGSLPAPSKPNALEHLLVYSPSGHVIQHELLPSSGSESSDNSPTIGPGSHLQLQDDELHVTAEPVQWWDVCRRTNWPERDQDIANVVFHNQLNSMMTPDTSDCEDSDHSDFTPSNDGVSRKEVMKVKERSSWYLSNAEVHISSWRIPIWEKSKICFYVMDHPATESREAVSIHGGEIEIEKLALHEVELRRRELLPVFKQFHYPEQNRNLASRQFQNALSGIDSIQYSLAKDSDAYGPKPVPHISGFYTDMRKTENMNGLAGQLFSGPIPPADLPPKEKCNSIGSPEARNLNHKVDNESIGYVSTPIGTNASTIMPQSREGVDCVPSHIRPLSNYSLLDGPLDNGSPSPASNESCGPEIANNSSVSNGTIKHIPNGGHSSVNSGQNETPGSENSGEFTQYFQEGYCKISELDDCRELTEAVTDADSSSSHCEREKPEEDGDNDDMLGGVFAFSEEG